jgi:stringent starvation protein B
MKPKRPYLLRAMSEWILDSNMTPYVLVDATVDGVQVPLEHVQDGKIVLNLSPSAVRALDLGPDAVACDGRFGGRPFGIYLPMRAIVAIYAKESGEGMVFEDEAFPDPSPPAPGADGGPGSKPAAARVSHLKRVK